LDFVGFETGSELFQDLFRRYLKKLSDDQGEAVVR